VIVLDGSVTASWILADGRPAVAALDRALAEDGIVPYLWYFEVANLVRMAEKRGRVPSGRGKLLFEKLEPMRIRVDGDGHLAAWHRTFDLASAHSLTIYDAAYLELALRRGVPLATLDRELTSAARALGVEVISG